MIVFHYATRVFLQGLYSVFDLNEQSPLKAHEVSLKVSPIKGIVVAK